VWEDDIKVEISCEVVHPIDMVQHAVRFATYSREHDGLLGLLNLTLGSKRGPYSMDLVDKS